MKNFPHIPNFQIPHLPLTCFTSSPFETVCVYTNFLFSCTNRSMLHTMFSMLFVTRPWLTLFCYNIGEKNKIDSELGTLCGVCTFSRVCVGFLLGHGFPPTPQRHACEVNCVSTFSPCEWVWAWVHPVMEGSPVQGGSCLAPWAAEVGPCHPQPWTGTSRLESHPPVSYSSFLGVWIAHIYFNVH